jgi:hypothetical protein
MYEGARLIYLMAARREREREQVPISPSRAHPKDLMSFS